MLANFQSCGRERGLKKPNKHHKNKAVSKQAIVTAAWILAFARCTSSDFLAREKEK